MMHSDNNNTNRLVALETLSAIGETAVQFLEDLWRRIPAIFNITRNVFFLID